MDAKCRETPPSASRDRDLAAEHISSTHEDYLETVYLLVQEHGFARVKDIAKARDVKAATISIAMRKLAEADYVNYEKREYINLTAKGEEAARRVLSRHRLLTRFFSEVLNMPADAASKQACSMEHWLTNEAMVRMVRFIEFLGSCPFVLETFRRCPIGVRPEEHGECSTRGQCAGCAFTTNEGIRSLADMRPGERATVSRLASSGETRQRLLDTGLLPETELEMERLDSDTGSVRFRSEGANLLLTLQEAKEVLIR